MAAPARLAVDASAFGLFVVGHVPMVGATPFTAERNSRASVRHSGVPGAGSAAHPALVQLADDGLGEPDRIGDRLVVDVLRRVRLPVVVRRVLPLVAGGDRDALVAGGEREDPVGGVAQPQVRAAARCRAARRSSRAARATRPGTRAASACPRRAAPAGAASRPCRGRGRRSGRRGSSSAWRSMNSPMPSQSASSEVERNRTRVFSGGRSESARARASCGDAAGAVVVGAGHDLARADVRHERGAAGRDEGPEPGQPAAAEHGAGGDQRRGRPPPATSAAGWCRCSRRPRAAFSPTASVIAGLKKKAVCAAS